jgi:hypothetical protein
MIAPMTREAVHQRVWVLLMALVLGVGCDSWDDGTVPTVDLSQATGQQAQVIIYCSGDGVQEQVDVRWDDRTVFLGKTPDHRGKNKSMPFELVVVLTKPGSHSLQARCRNGFVKTNVRLQSGEKRCFMLYKPMDDRPLRIRDLGGNPEFL